MSEYAPTEPIPHDLDAMAAYTFTLAISEGWSGFLLWHLFDGGGLTLDMKTRRPILISKAEIDQIVVHDE